MFGLSFTHLVLLAVIVLIFLGPEQLPEVARTLARLVNEWKRASSELQTSLMNEQKPHTHEAPSSAATAPPAPVPETSIEGKKS